MQDNSHDPRIVANAILERNNLCPITQISLQKLLYFAHGIFLQRYKKPLVSGYFEAWTYGPVHPAVYSSFRSAGNRPIDFRAMQKDLRTGDTKELPELKDIEALRIINHAIAAFGDLTPAQLVQLSHASGGPWDKVSKRAQSEKMLGLRISNELISSCFQYHKVSSCKFVDLGDFGDDAPIAHHGLG